MTCRTLIAAAAVLWSCNPLRASAQTPSPVPLPPPSSTRETKTEQSQPARVKPQLLGWIEHVRIEPEEIVVAAKLDTGADHSALDAKNLEEYEKDGRSWVSFDVKDRYGKIKRLRAEAIRVARIKRLGHKAESRVVIRLRLCLGERMMESQVSLVNRSKLSTAMLVGRDFLAGNAVVDPSKTYTSAPACGHL